ncbi:MAG: hypothetical protein GWM92_21375 [Gemmatimonadetes bacterium]|nr:hypothetical protein [Gemmatimonadota bacterium]NIR81408.1 hypothetical protein [Gemmatimonadota bacterium]NIT90243.1 hypothetical protein [Gemmatimonadota bacterium]NIU34071.1 hypothetical protein [Gemmatimonadota bacterium]NIU38228.1 hypothetical protein [Gemmatimonadota bacterium]
MSPLLLAAALGLIVPAHGGVDGSFTRARSSVGPASAPCAADPTPPAYYAFPLVGTGNVPGTGRASGTGEVVFPSTPFGVAVGPDGSYRLEVWLSFENLPEPRSGRWVAWLTTPTLDRVERIGALEDGAREIRGRVGWNKFLVVVTLEPEGHERDGWSGPIVLRGMSRSGAMHTMAGHGPFQQENCARYGY